MHLVVGDENKVYLLTLICFFRYSALVIKLLI